MSAHATQQTVTTRRADPQRAATHQPLAAAHSRITPINRLQRAVGNRALASLLRSPVIQPKLEVSEPDDEFEREADRVADRVMRMPDNELHRKPDQISRRCSDCEEETVVHAKRLPSHPPVSSGPENYLSVTAGRGEPLSDGARSYFEPRFGYDFSGVRVHTDANAATLSRSLGARAFTYRDHIYFNQHEFNPGHTEGKRLLAHELAHVTQQSVTAKPRLHRRLLLTGTPTEIADFIAMSETASGLVLQRNALTNEVIAIASSATPATSPTFERELTRIMNDPIQDAEINVGIDQPGVDIGAFPVPSDLTGARVQNVDMDDINAMEAGAPGIGVADLLHEIVENFEAHAFAPVPGVDLFPGAHQAGLAAEAGVARDIVGSGRRVAQADMPIGTNVTRIAEDYDTFYVLSTLTNNPVTGSFTRSNVSFAPKVTVVTLTIDNFATNSDVVPAAGAGTIGAVAFLMAFTPLATVRIEGFTDDRGSVADNLDLGARRGENAAADLVAAGLAPGRIQLEPRGETGFVAPNNTEANRALNRRVVITITRPGP